MENSKVFREYLSDDSFKTRPGQLSGYDTKYQLCLAYATNPGDGNFRPQWDTQKVTIDVINHFKEICKITSLPVTVFVSIGGDDPFEVGVPPDVWISCAKSSLQQIIADYSIDGIDVSYTKIQQGSQSQFVKCINNLLTELREDNPAFVASIAPTAATHGKYYLPLYKAIGSSWLGTVVFQCFVDLGLTPLSDENPVQSLVHKVENIVEQYPLKDDTKVLLGYSAIEEDWSIVTPPLFYLALNHLVKLPPRPRVNGASLKVISDPKANILVTTWTPQFLYLEVADAPYR